MGIEIPRNENETHDNPCVEMRLKRILHSKDVQTQNTRIVLKRAYQQLGYIRDLLHILENRDDQLLNAEATDIKRYDAMAMCLAMANINVAYQPA